MFYHKITREPLKYFMGHIKPICRILSTVVILGITERLMLWKIDNTNADYSARGLCIDWIYVSNIVTPTFAELRDTFKYNKLRHFFSIWAVSHIFVPRFSKLAAALNKEFVKIEIKLFKTCVKVNEAIVESKRQGVVEADGWGAMKSMLCRIQP